MCLYNKLYILLLFPVAMSCNSAQQSIEVSAQQLAGDYQLSWHFYNGLYKVNPSGVLSISEDSTYTFATCGGTEYGRWMIENDSIAFYFRPDSNLSALLLSFRAIVNDKNELIYQGGKILRGSWLIKNRKPLNVFYKSPSQ